MRSATITLYEEENELILVEATENETTPAS